MQVGFRQIITEKVIRRRETFGALLRTACLSETPVRAWDFVFDQILMVGSLGPVVIFRFLRNDIMKLLINKHLRNDMNIENVEKNIRFC